MEETGKSFSRSPSLEPLTRLIYSYVDGSDIALVQLLQFSKIPLAQLAQYDEKEVLCFTLEFYVRAIEELMRLYEDYGEGSLAAFREKGERVLRIYGRHEFSALPALLMWIDEIVAGPTGVERAHLEDASDADAGETTSASDDDKETPGAMEPASAIEDHPLYSEFMDLGKHKLMILALDAVRRGVSNEDYPPIKEACKEAARFFLPHLKLGAATMRKDIPKYLKDEYNKRENLDGFSFMKLVDRAMKDLELIQFVELADLLTSGNACETSENGD